MAFADKKGIVVASPFKLQAESMLDVRQQVDTLTERNELVTIKAATAGLRVYVKETKKSYVYNGTTWDELSIGNASLVVTLNGGTSEGTNKFTYNGTAAKTVNITADGIGAASKTHNHTKSQITDFPTSMKNPQALKFTGGATATYDGSEAVTVNIPTTAITSKSLIVTLNGGTTEGTNKFTFNGSAEKNINITPSTIGAAAATHTHNVNQITGLTTGRALVSDANGHPSVSSTTATELSYLHGVTSSVQTQLNNKAALNHTHNYAGSSSAGGAANSAVKLQTARKLNGVSFDGSANVNIPNNYFASVVEEDLNEKVAFGEYYGVGGNSCENLPSGVNWFYLRVFRTADGYVGQNLYANGTWYSRYKNGTSWTSWSEQYSSTNKPTPSEIGAAASSHTHTASQITGLPTSLKNPYAITFTGAATGTYDGSRAVTINIPTTGASTKASLVIQLNGGTTEGDDKFTFNGGTAKTVNITPASIGAAAASHGTHVTYGTTAPKANGTASAGSANSVSRSDHVHPLQTTVSGNAGTATKLQTKRTINDVSFDGTANITLNSMYAESLLDKNVSLNNYNLNTGKPTIKWYTCPTDGGGDGITGRPNDTNKQAFLLKCESIRWASNTDYITKQTYIQGSTNTTYERYCVNGTWKAWGEVYTSNNKPTASEIGAAASSHNHSASNITSGILPVARGGTGLTASPSLLVNLASTSAASVLTASPRPGITGTLPVSHGGTGATTALAANYNILKSATENTVGFSDSTMLAYFTGSPSTSVGAVRKYKAGNVWSQWLNGKISASYAAKSHTHNYAGSSSAGGAANSVKTSLTVRLNGGNTEGTNKFTFNGSAAKTINITPGSIGAATSSHTHNYAGSSSAGGAANSANRLNGISLTGGSGNTTGYRLIATVNINAWGNYRGVFAVNSRHTGAGLLCISVGCDNSSVSFANAYSEIMYFGPVDFGNIITSDSFLVHMSSNGTKAYIFWKYSDYNITTIVTLDSDFAISNGTWMTSISTSTYGNRKATTTINPSSAHNHSASNITSGILPVARGGTGLTASPSLLVNLASTSAASVLTASPRPGITGTLPVSHGGTGATTALAANYNILNSAIETTSGFSDSTMLAYFSASPSASAGAVRKYKAGNVWNQWLNGKISASYAAKSHTHNYAGSSSAGGAANSVKSSLTLQFNGTTKATFNGSAAATVNITPSSIGAAASSHTHNYAGSSSAGGAANSVKAALTLQLNGSTKATFNGSTAATVNITASSIGAAASNHTHSYLPLSGGTVTGDIGLPSGRANKDGSTPFAGSTINLSSITKLANYKTVLGSYTDSNNKWYDIISVRHRNGNGDGSSYGMYLKSDLTTSGNLSWGKQYGSSSWQAERTLIDSSNYGSWCAAKSHTHNYAGSSSAGGAANSANRVPVPVGTVLFATSSSTTFFNSCFGGTWEIVGNIDAIVGNGTTLTLYMFRKTKA